MKHNKLFEYCTLAIFGGETYVTIEVFYREHSHWSMFVLGALCFIGIGLINQLMSWETPLWIQMIISGFGIVTPLELLCGYIVNICLGWNVWDYSNLPFNLYGQISLSSSIGWCFLSVIGIVIDDFIRWQFFEERKPEYKIF
jgi:uncharacterized membrane protein